MLVQSLAELTVPCLKSWPLLVTGCPTIQALTLKLTTSQLKNLPLSLQIHFYKPKTTLHEPLQLQSCFINQQAERLTFSPIGLPLSPLWALLKMKTSAGILRNISDGLLACFRNGLRRLRKSFPCGVMAFTRLLLKMRP